MGKFISAVKDSLEVFSGNPKLVLPKLLVSLFYSFAIVFGVKFIVDFVSEPDASMVASGLFVLGLEFVSLLLDTIVNLMFPILVRQQREGGKISFMQALGEIRGKFLRTVAPIAIVLVGITALATAWAGIYLIVLGGSIDPSTPDFLAFAAPLMALAVAVAFLFYAIFPVSALESGPVGESLSRTVKFTFSNLVDVAKAISLSLLLSALSFAIAISMNFVSEGQSLLFWAAFLIVRFVTAYIATYTYVLNPVFYFHYAGTPANSSIPRNENALKGKAPGPGKRGK